MRQRADIVTSATVVHIGGYVVFASIGTNSVAVAIAGITTGDDTSITVACSDGIGEGAEISTYSAVVYVIRTR
jgi:hypothetical protein